MYLIQTDRPAREQAAEISRLVNACRQFRPIQFDFPFDDGSVFYLAYENTNSASSPVLVCALALIIPCTGDFDESAECLAFTHPDHRRKGYFSALWATAKERLDDFDVLIPCDGQDEAVIPVLKAIGAEYDSCEYRMELPLPAETSAFLAHNGEFAAGVPNPPVPFRRRLGCRFETESDGSVLYSFFPLQEQSRPAAICRTVSFGTQVCFYGFLVEETFRGLGLGKEALLSVIRLLSSQGAESLFLHVSGDNTAAVNLYKKTGFRITETLFYYLY